MITVIDLFCGAGGFSKGFKDCGFEILLGIDNQTHKLITYSRNIKPKYYLAHKNYLLKGSLRKNSDVNKVIKSIEIKNDLEQLTKRKIVQAIKGEKVDVIIGSPPCKDFSRCNESKDAFCDRANLYKEFIRIVKLFKPTWFVLENVVEFFYSKNGELLESEFSVLGYNVKLFVSNCIDFGVPQERNRGFIIGYLNSDNFNLDNYKNNNRITIEEAISDLEVEENSDTLYKYELEAKSEYQKSLRKDISKVKNHITTKHEENTIDKIIKVKMKDGKKRIGYYTVKNYNDISGVITSEFNNPSAKGESIHPKLNRTFTAREAARIQSFPDDFEFYGSIDEVALQIGDAVPPLVATAIANMIRNNMANN